MWLAEVNGEDQRGMSWSHTDLGNLKVRLLLQGAMNISFCLDPALLACALVGV